MVIIMLLLQYRASMTCKNRLSSFAGGAFSKVPVTICHGLAAFCCIFPRLGPFVEFILLLVGFVCSICRSEFDAGSSASKFVTTQQKANLCPRSLES